jgi:hypothetical protein
MELPCRHIMAVNVSEEQSPIVLEQCHFRYTNVFHGGELQAKPARYDLLLV